MIWPSDLKDRIVGSVLLAVLVGSVIANFVYLRSKSAFELDRPEMKSKLGALYSEIDVHSQHALLWTTIFYLIRLLTAVLITVSSLMW